MTLISNEQTSVHFALVSNSGVGVLAVRENCEIVLPHTFVPAAPWWETEPIVKAAETLFGVPVRVLRCLAGNDNQVDVPERVYAIEVIGSPPAMPAGFWLPPSELSKIELSETTATELRTLLIARDSPHSKLELCEPWIRRGWYDEVQELVLPVIARDAHSPVVWRQLRAWPRSCVYELTAGRKRYILKACPKAYATEAALTAYLANTHPSLISEVLTCDAGRGIFLTRAFDGKEAQLSATKILENAAQSLARLQCSEAAYGSKHAKLGVPVTDLSSLAASTKELIEDEVGLMVGRADGLTSQELAQLRTAASNLDNAFTRLASLGIPASLEHGDFRAANILQNGPHKPLRIIDWGNATLSHPFFSIAQLLDEENYPGDTKHIAVMKQTIARAFLEPWRQGYDETTLIEALAIARILMPIARAIERRERLLPSLASPANWAFSITFWVRRFLLYMAAGSRPLNLD